MNISNAMPGLTSHSDVADSFTDYLSLPYPDPLPLPQRFAKLKQKLIAGHETAIVDSFYRLLRRLREEADRIARVGSEIIPTIDYLDINDPHRTAIFSKNLKERGVAIIRGVVPTNVAAAWKEETLEYIDQSPHIARGYPAHDPQMFDLYWSPGQVRARADSRMLEAQRFVMRAAWHHKGSEDALVSTDHPVAYADRFRIRQPGDVSMGKGPHVDGGSVERWEPDGYGRGGGTYQKIFEGRWEEHDPWDSSARLAATSDLYNGAGACSMFRMFQGWLALSSIAPGEGTLLVCPMLQLTTAYILLRPFFQPRFACGHGHGHGLGLGSDEEDGDEDEEDDPDYHHFLHASNWTLQARPFDSVVQGAVPGHIQELSDALHPHLRLRQQRQGTLVSIPRVSPGDWVVWHPDLVHAAEALHAGAADAAALYVPACPLTQTNALYLARQRRSFLLGLPAPDFFGTTSGAGSGGGGGSVGGFGLGLGGAIVVPGGGAGEGSGGGGGVVVVGGGATRGAAESAHLGRPGVQDVNDAGGEDGLRAMGLLAFDEGKTASCVEREVVRLANGILFPDRFDLGYRRRATTTKDT